MEKTVVVHIPVAIRATENMIAKGLPAQLPLARRHFRNRPWAWRIEISEGRAYLVRRQVATDEDSVKT